MPVADQFIQTKTRKTPSAFGGVSSQFIKTSPVTSRATSQFITKPELDLSDETTLEELIQRAGLEAPVKKQKLSVLQRLSAGLGAFETGHAVATGIEQKNVAKGVGAYITGIGKGLASAVTGRDFGQSQKKSFRDVLEKGGVENKIAKNGIGILLDILTDPTTYFGGAIAKAAVKGSQKAGSAALKGVGKIAPESEQGLRMAGKGLTDAFGRAVVFGYGASKGLPEKALEISSDLARTRSGIIKSYNERLGTRTLSHSQQEELVERMLAGKRAEREVGRAEEAGRAAAREAAQSSDPAVAAAIQSQTARSRKLAKTAGIADPYEVYFPGLRKDKLERILDGTKPFKIGSQGYRKEWKDAIADDNLLKDPVEAFARREWEIVKDKKVGNELQGIVRQFGKPIHAFKTADEAAAAGFVSLKAKGIFGEPLGWVTEQDKAVLDSVLGFDDTYAVVDAIAKHTGFDYVLSLFKRSVTGLFAPFHVRNYVSGLIQNYEVLGPHALNPKTIAQAQNLAFRIARGKKATGTLKLGTSTYSASDVIKPFVGRFESSSQYISDFNIASERMFPKLAQKLNPLSQENYAFRGARAVGNFIETQQKLVAYLTALKTGRSVKEALNYAARAGFDYRALTQFESKVLRRIIPFYSFTRKNIELQLRTLGENPQRINQIINVLEGMSDVSAEERGRLPDYAKEQFVFRFGGTADIPEISVGAGTPLEAFAQLFSRKPLQEVASMMNPVLKLPLERTFNKDFFRDRPLDEVIEAGEYSRAPQFIKDFLDVKEVKSKNKDGTEKIKYHANPYKLQLLRNLPTTRGATYLSAITNQETSDVARLLNALTGVKPRAIDLETVEYFRDKKRMEELEKLLLQAGVLRKFQKLYIPKNN